MSSDSECSNNENPDTLLALRVASVFVILVCATAETLFPVLEKRSKQLHVPKSLFEFAKYFGSGVIIATSFIHLLAPGLEELSSECLSPAWQEYPYALALCLLSIMSIFILELIAFHVHGHHVGSHAAHGLESAAAELPSKCAGDSEEPLSYLDDSAAAQIIGVAILKFRALLHRRAPEFSPLCTSSSPGSVLIGLTLAVDSDEDFKILFIIIFHRTFEGLGLGSRLAFMKLPPKYSYVRIVAGIVYGLSTPIGIAVGLRIRSSYNPGSTIASIMSGVLDSLSAGLLIYTGLVELLAHEFLFNKEIIYSSNWRLAYAVGSMLFGCALMALLGKWA
ncbi:ZIP-like iron-zinc transporter [Mycena rosella]|uniref:ZIP-like iron-zinc transporter n=1 Tax=Mycena rosella TaxID=1033263 RepID=A0AAD7DRY1_MYCRO|nr:ZIP-like iron-zinc transporter [Mycena rosella]